MPLDGNSVCALRPRLKPPQRNSVRSRPVMWETPAEDGGALQHRLRPRLIRIAFHVSRKLKIVGLNAPPFFSCYKYQICLHISTSRGDLTDSKEMRHRNKFQTIFQSIVILVFLSKPRCMREVEVCISQDVRGNGPGN